MNAPSLGEMFHRMLRAEGQGRPARTVELFGWLILFEGCGHPARSPVRGDAAATAFREAQAEGYFRLVGLLAAGVGMLYVVSGRLDAQGFVFASLLDRPLVPGIMFVLWQLGFVPGALALAFAVQDFGSFLWTLAAWRRQTERGYA